MNPNMTDTSCSNPSCPQPGTLRCGRCKTARYCSQSCQKSQWTAHKAACKASTGHSLSSNVPKSNCYILRAAPQTTDDNNNAPVVVLDNIAEQIVPFQLEDLGDEGKEMRQLEKELGWKGAMEVGKFYDHKGSDGWYYYVYGDARAFNRKSKLPVNEAAGLVCRKRPIYGDVGIVRSGPMGAEYAVEFPKKELVRAVEFYKDNDKDKVFAQREMSRMKRNYGYP